MTCNARIYQPAKVAESALDAVLDTLPHAQIAKGLEVTLVKTFPQKTIRILPGTERITIYIGYTTVTVTTKPKITVKGSGERQSDVDAAVEAVTKFLRSLSLITAQQKIVTAAAKSSSKVTKIDRLPDGALMMNLEL